MPPEKLDRAFGAKLIAAAGKTDGAGRVRYAFGAAHLAKSLVWSLVDLLWGWYLYAVLGLPAGEIAALLSTLLLFGALCDAVVGALLSWSQATARFMLNMHAVASLATAITMSAQFLVTKEHAAWLLPIGMSFRLAYASYDVPQNAFTSMLPVDDRDAAAYVRLRTVLSAVARLLVTSVNLAMTQLPQTLFRASGAVVLFLFGVALTATALILSRAAKGARTREPTFRSMRFRGEAFPKGLLLVLLAFFISTTFFAFSSRLLIFIGGAQPGVAIGPALLLAFCAGSVIGPLIADVPRPVLGELGGIVLWIAIGVVGGDLVLLVPPTPIFSALSGGLYGIGAGAIGISLWRGATSVAIRHAEATGMRADGLVFGLVIFVIQLSIAASALLMGRVLDGIVAGDLASRAVAAGCNTLSGLALALVLAGQVRRTRSV